MGENNEKINILDEMDKLVDRKLSEVKSVVPVILTIITAVITFLVSINVPKENELFWGFAILAIICSLMSFLYLLFAFYPVLRLKKSYKISADIDKKINSIKNKVSNSNTGLIPWNLKSYIKIPDEEFLVELKKYLQRDLTEDEKIKANFLKGKLNELYWKRRLLNTVYAVLVIGTITFIVLYYVSIAIM